MCDLVSIARKHLLPLLSEAVNMIRQTPVEVEKMKNQLQTVQDLIHEADRKTSAEGEKSKRDEIKKMLKELIEASFEMEDVLDEYIVCQQQLQSRDPRCVAFNPEEAANFIRPVITRVHLAYKIHHLNLRVDEIKKKCQIHDASESQSSSEQGQGGSNSGEHKACMVRNLRENDPLTIKEDDTVGFEVPKAKLIDLLVKGEEERTVISVVGMGGQGKTTLARKIFQRKEVIAHFDCHAWITVSRSYSVEGLLRDMLLQFDKEKYETRISTMGRKALDDEVTNYFQEKRYVVFLDDVWDTKLWDEIKYVMIDDTKGSRIFVTTRKSEVAEDFKKSSLAKVHDLKLLDDKQSYELFCKKAFRSYSGGICPKNLEYVSSEIVKKCEGLPLAIEVIGRVLSTKNHYEWNDFSKNLFSELKNPDLDCVTKILTFSYDDLPSYLKPCLLYFGMYPEDFAVKSQRLICQWIAEGFIKQQKGKTLEKVAEGYLKELIQRSLVQESSFNIYGKVKRCRVHDMVREMIIRKAEDLNFCQYIHEDEDQSALDGTGRRLSIATSLEALPKSNESSHIRSLLFLTNNGSTVDLAKRIPAQYKLLKVLDFEKTPPSFSLPESFLDLLHLKYLSFRGTYLEDLPGSFVKLQNLETLDLRRTMIIHLPKEIGKLRNLRHLLGSFVCSGGYKYFLRGLKSLQTLSKLFMKSSDEALIKELGELTQLRRLSLVASSYEEEESILWDSINNMKLLEKLDLRTGKESTLFRDLHCISPRKTLQKLHLHGTLEKLPEWIFELPNLVRLKLTISNLTDDPLESLKNLPNLLSLTMDRCYEGESLHFQSGDFQNLKQLELEEIQNLNSIIIDKGSLQSLKEFSLRSLYQLKAIPSGIQHLEKLEVLNLDYIPQELVRRITPHGGQDHWMINHVTSLDIFPTLSVID